MERDSRKIVKRLLADGFVLVSSKGRTTSFAAAIGRWSFRTRKKDLPLGTARSIARMAGWD